MSDENREALCATCAHTIRLEFDGGEKQTRCVLQTHIESTTFPDGGRYTPGYSGSHIGVVACSRYERAPDIGEMLTTLKSLEPKESRA
jgi:hypothetical protein